MDASWQEKRCDFVLVQSVKEVWETSFKTKRFKAPLKSTEQENFPVCGISI